MFLNDLYTYLTADVPDYVRGMGYLSQSISLQKRYIARSLSWEGHLENSRKFIMESAEKCTRFGKVILLGSGILLDVPLESLSKKFGEVILVDVVHLPHILKGIEKYKNVRAVQADITDIAEKMFDNVRRNKYELPEGEPFVPELDNDTGLVVSLNIFSQLYAFPLDYIQKKYMRKNTWTITDEKKESWCRGVLEAHYAMLRSLNSDVCFIADHYFVRKKKDGSVLEEGSTVADIPLPLPERLWTWDIAPYERENGGSSKHLTVGGWHFGTKKNK